MSFGRSWKYLALSALASSAVLAACSDDPEPGCTPVRILAGDPASVPAAGWYSSDTRSNGTVSSERGVRNTHRPEPATR